MISTLILGGGVVVGIPHDEYGLRSAGKGDGTGAGRWLSRVHAVDAYGMGSGSGHGTGWGGVGRGFGALMDVATGEHKYLTFIREEVKGVMSIGEETPADVVRRVMNKAVEDAVEQNPEWAELLARVSDERRFVVEQAIVCKEHRLAGPALTNGPHPMLVARWVLGEHPTELADGVLTRAEASAWIRQSKHPKPLDWLWATKGDSEVRRPNELEVIRWVIKALNNPERAEALRRDRTGLDGEGAFIKRLDELDPEDLVADSIRAVFVASSNRRVKQMWDGDPILRDPPTWAGNLPDGVKVLTTAPDLVREGSEMRHCVGDYCHKVADRECHIFSVTIGSSRSTAEFSNSGQLLQHVGPRNESPAAACVRLLDRVAKTIPWSVT